MQIGPTAPYTVTVVTGGQVAAGLNFADQGPPPDPTKFYVVNDGSPDRTYEYGPSGTSVENYALATGNTAPRGAASNADGSTVWVIDANKTIYVYDSAGASLGSWTAINVGNSQFEGITTDGVDVWLVDAKNDRVLKYTGRATWHSGSSNFSSSFALASGNKNPKDLVTDGAHIWVVDDAATNKVFKYTMTGTLVGSWTIASPNSTPTGITLDPTGESNDLWIVDSGTDKLN